MQETAVVTSAAWGAAQRAAGREVRHISWVGHNGPALHLWPRPHVSLMLALLVEGDVGCQPGHQQVGPLPGGTALQEGEKRGQAVCPYRINELLGLHSPGGWVGWGVGGGVGGKVNVAGLWDNEQGA